MTGFEPVILFLIIGFGLLAAARAPLGRLHGALAPGLGFLAGVYAVTLILMLMALATRHFYLPVFWALATAGAGALIWRRGDWLPRLAGWREALKLGPPGTAVIVILLAGASLYNVYLVVAMAYRFPVIGYDAIGNYMMKAALWYDTRELFPAKLMDPEFVMYHRRYPAGITIAEVIWFFMLGGIDLVRIKGFFLACWLLQSAMIFGMLRRRNGRVIAWIGAAFWIMLPYHLTEYQGGVIDGYPEIPFILAMLGAVAMARTLGREKGWAAAAVMAFFVAGPFLFKQEGLVFSFFLTLYLLIRRAPLRNVAMIGGFTGINIAIWLLAGRGVPAHLDESYASINIGLGEVLPRLRELREYAAGVFADELQWGLTFSLLGVVWVYRLFRLPWRNWVTTELVIGALMTVFYIATLINTPLDFEQHLESTTDRLFLHSLPLYIIATFDRLESAHPLKDLFVFKMLAARRNSTQASISNHA